MRKPTIIDKRQNISDSEKVTESNVGAFLDSIFPDAKIYTPRNCSIIDGLFLFANELSEETFYVASIEHGLIFIWNDKNEFLIQDWQPVKYKVTKTVTAEMYVVQPLTDEIMERFKSGKDLSEWIVQEKEINTQIGIELWAK